ncbi:MAG: N-acetylmuramoyl-L-alanine amidase, partial [Spirochaetes bacterium]|nr:N-acetylmuramoyl-L-alanine amidase [Spirochaetota bacterium]
INELEPELVITLHLTHTQAPKQGGMATVITPGYKTYENALRYVRSDGDGRKAIRSRFAKGPWANWFISDDKYTTYPSFMADAFIYYIGFWSKNDGVHTDYKRFRGYRHNLVDWNYADSDSIVDSLYGQKGERYATTLAAFEPKGKFWEREKSEPETWRREGGPEGFGGDNHFAGMETLRFVRKAFVVNGFDTASTAPKILKPYMSTWAVPTYVNAVAAFVEIAHTTSKRDHLRMAKHRRIYAEGIAVAAYSLLYGMKDVGMAKGKKLPLERYENLTGGNYFKRVKKKHA